MRTPWHSGSASDSISEGCEFESHSKLEFSLFIFFAICLISFSILFPAPIGYLCLFAGCMFLLFYGQLCHDYVIVTPAMCLTPNLRGWEGEM